MLDEAIAWHLRLATGDEADWEAFTLWLEASSSHALAYDQVAMTDALLADSDALAQAELPRAADNANDNLPAPVRGRWWLVGGVASVVAAAAVTLAILPGVGREPPSSIYETPTGVARTVDMADGSRIELGGGSRLTVDGGTPRLAALDRGEAVFHVRHDPARPFTVKVNDVAVEDLGTVFSIRRDSDAVRVAVAEGSVGVSRAARRVTLGPGEIATATQDDIAAGRIDPKAVGSWRNRRLTFQGEPLSIVVERLNRLYALHISLAPNLSGRPFTGMVQLTGDAARDVPHLAALIGTSWRRDGEGWLLSSADSSQR